MPVRVIHFQHRDRRAWGVARAGRIQPVPGTFDTTEQFLRAFDVGALHRLEGESLDEREVQLLSPVTRNQQFLCLGANYRQHMVESGMDPDAKTFNMVFTKSPTCIVPADYDLIKPRRVRLLDYEIELGLVLKRDVTRPTVVTDGTLPDFIAGLVIVNDYSARDIQIPQSQFYKGKSFRTFGPVGPYLCLLEPEDFAYLRKLELRLTVNGEVRQKDSTRNLVHGPSETLSELSEVQDLQTGDLISTGTPSGCALSVPSPLKQRMAALLPEAAKWQAFLAIQEARTQYLKVGDLVEAHIASEDGTIDLGVQRNRVVGETVDAGR